MEESGPHKHSILRNKEVPKKNAPHKPRDVTRPTVMVKRYGFRGTLSIKYKIVFLEQSDYCQCFGLKPSSFEPKPTA